MVAAAISGRFSPLTDSVSRALESSRANLEVRADREAFTLDLTFPAGVWSEVRETLPAILGQRLLKGLRLDDLRAEQLRRLQELRHDPRGLALRVYWQEALTGDNGTPAEGTDSEIATVTVEDIQKFCETHFTSGNYVLGLAGNVTSEQAAALDFALQQSLPSGNRRRRVYTCAIPAGLNVRIVEVPECDDSFLMVGTGLPHGTVDTAAWVFAFASAQQAVAGASLAGLEQFVRAERGISDDVEFTTGLAVSNADGAFWKTMEASTVDYFTVAVTTKPVNAIYALRIILKELTDLNSAGLSQEALSSVHALFEKDDDSRDPVTRMQSDLQKKLIGVEIPDPVSSGQPLPLSTVRTRQMIRSAFDPRNLWVVLVTSDGKSAADAILGGTTSYLYPEWVNRHETRVLDQEYLSFRPFWEASKIRVLQAEELFR